MLRSLFSAISGLRGHQIMMDVIANNIANVNTVGFKSGRVNFQDILSQTMRGGTAPTDTLGSINPAQIGLGVSVAGIDVLHTQGNLQSTGKLTDVSIQGDGFFVLADGIQQYYTRDGAFEISLDGSLVNPATGLKVLGWVADSSGSVDTTGALTELSIPIGQRTTALATNATTLRGNLDAGAAVADQSSTTITVFDSLGVRHTIRVTFEKTDANTWSWTAAADPSDGTIATVAQDPDPGEILFTSDGQVDGSTPDASMTITFSNGATDSTVTLDLSNLTQFSGSSEVTTNGNGFTSGTLVTFAVGNGGEITGVYSNGQTEALGQIALASFLNPSGLNRVGQNAFQASAASGDPSVGVPGGGGRGRVVTGALEMSNVDLAAQFTGMITAQRGFQASGRVITTSDQMLEELVNLKR